jgi:hypothetical protein
MIDVDVSMMLSDDSLVKFIWLKLGEFDKKG